MTARYDLFLSYSHDDTEAAQRICKLVQSYRPGLRVFLANKEIAPGTSWLMEIAESLDTVRRVAALMTPSYWESKYCKDEFCAAYVRQTDTGRSLLYPIHFRDTQIPYFFKAALQYKGTAERRICRN